MSKQAVATLTARLAEVAASVSTDPIDVEIAALTAKLAQFRATSAR